MPGKHLPRRYVAALAVVAACCVALLSWRIGPARELFGHDPRACSAPAEPSAVPVAPAKGQEASSGKQADDRRAVDEAFAFLDKQMDLYHGSTIVYSEPEFSTYYPSGKIGDVDNISIDSGFKGAAHSGRTSLKVDYRPAASGGRGWAGVYFLYPDGNWGQFAGRNLSGATRLSFWVCADRDTRAEFFLGGIKDPRFPYFDTLPKVSTGVVAVTTTWQRHEIDLTGHDLTSVIGGFAVAMSREQDSGARSLFLDDVEFDLPRLDEPRFVQSYVPDDCAAGGVPNAAQVYDQALVLLAFLARGRPDDLVRADLIARALVEAQHKDRAFKDGRLRNAYASGELIDPRYGVTRIPGAYDPTARRFLEDENAVGSDTGNMAWAALALVKAHALLPKRAGDPYLNAALSLARWVSDNTRIDDALGGFAAGVQGFERAAGNPEGQERKNYRATEHNIDLDALFARLADAAGPETPDGRYWTSQAAHARTFVDKMRNDGADAQYLWTGARPDGTINKSVIPLDAQTWAVLRTREPATYAAALDWALRNCSEKGRHDAFGFKCDNGDGAWWEGTAQVAAALRWLKRDQDAVPVLARLREAQLSNTKSPGALPAASRCGLPTGFDLSYRSGKTIPWLYPDLPHIGATAWFIFAALGINPYFVTDRPPAAPF
jgi:hypothetical protein